MSRKAGTPNKKKEKLFEPFTKEQTEIMEKELDSFTGVVNVKDKYLILEISSKDVLSDSVNRHLAIGYECQGGVSVTNYRANDGSIVMVYCQAMVRRD
jgi:hypothetical protein